LVARAQAGDRDAFAALYERHQAGMFRFALHLTGERAAADDVVQEVFVAFMRGLARFTEGRPLRAYLYGIARHIAARRVRRNRLWVPFDVQTHEPATGPAVTDDLQRQEDLLHLRQAILALPRKYREVIVLCDLEQLPYEDAAASMGCAVGTIRSRLHRARTRLARLLERQEQETRRFVPRVPGCAL
jgi:RNA polymerase sigma-70 factor (ECF subfamily)